MIVCKKLMFCMSKNSTIAIIDSLGNDADVEVLNWKDALTPSHDVNCTGIKYSYMNLLTCQYS